MKQRIRGNAATNTFIVEETFSNGYTNFTRYVDGLIHNDKGPAFVNLSLSGPRCDFWLKGKFADRSENSEERAADLIQEYWGYSQVDALPRTIS